MTQSGTTLTVNRNGALSTLNTTGVSRLLLNGLEGDDRLWVDRSVTLPALLDGGAGKDTLHGGQGPTEYYGGPGSDAVDFVDATSGLSVYLDNAPNDAINGQSNVHDDVETVLGGRGNDTLVGSFFTNILVGNGGNDTIRDGGGGRDLMIGGDGADSLAGNGADDLLIAGRTAYDASFFSLLSLRGAWGGSGSYPARISQLKTGVSGAKITSSTVFNDSAIDSLLGGTASDWFVVSSGDAVKDRSSSETVTIL